jgi:phosphopantothenoylcysteine decarboxylase/phosphopantothenate--cysteine ligase
MDLDMYAHPANQRNIDLLKQFGAHFAEPTSGDLASGLSGKGRMQEPEAIVEKIRELLAGEKKKTLTGKKILVTAGPTYEDIDPVRFIGNYSSGKMGFAIAGELAQRGATVCLVAGPVNLQTPPGDIIRRDVKSASDMDAVCGEWFPDCQAGIFAAAVADYAPAEPSEDKMKRSGEEVTIRLKPNPDIAAHMGAIKTETQKTIGFALETRDGESNARQKIEKKNFDLIILNSPNQEGEGFLTDTNRITIIGREQYSRNFPLKSKTQVAVDIVSALEEIMPS